jgi:hypothetical protein
MAAAPEPTPEPTPVPTPEPTPTPAKVAQAPKAVPTPAPKPTPAKPTPAAPATTPVTAPPAKTAAAAPAEPPKAARVAELLSQAEGAMGAQKFEAAVQAYDEALKLDPQNDKASAGKTAAAGAAAALKKTFVPGRTSVRAAEKTGKAKLGGFESEDVSVSDFRGRIEFEAGPPHPRPGDKYSVKVFVVNEGKKGMKLNGLTLTTSVNGSKSPASAAPKAKEVGAGQRVLAQEVSGTWADGTTAWSLEVQVAANKEDSLKSTLTWK